jgi:hypothetical protein
MKLLTTEQHQMLEDLTGKQYTRTGHPRKYPRCRSETIRLGLKEPPLDPRVQKMLEGLRAVIDTIRINNI